MRSLLRLIRYCLWLPFKVVTTPIVIALYLGLLAYKFPPLFFINLVGTMVVVGLCLPLEASLRPMPRNKQAKLPKREKPLAWAKVQTAAKRSGSVTSQAAMLRKLPAELRGVLAAPADRQPEAIKHDRQLAEAAR